MEEEVLLTKDQDNLFKLIDQGPYQCYAISGKPGTGKSVLIRHLVKHGVKHYVRAAPTGLAAINLMVEGEAGKTLHSLFWLPTSQGAVPQDYDVWPSNDKVLKKIKYQIKHLIIDEMSMVRADMFDYMDRLMRWCKGVPNMPFGGAQVILVGDFHQLPPVTKKEEEIQLRAMGYESPFLFHAKVFKENFKCFQLHEVLRQKGDDTFIQLLHAARTGQLSLQQYRLLNGQVGHPGDVRITLTSTNFIADNINETSLRAIDQPAHTYRAVSYGKWPENPVPETITLKVGAQVMVKKNGADKQPGSMVDKEGKDSVIVNGTMGIVKEILPARDTITAKDESGNSITTKAMPERVVIEVEGMGEVTIFKQRWELKERKLIPEELRFGGPKYEEEVIAMYEQIPLTLAWAISMHKSQGQSFSKVHINPRSIFAEGQLYVALSRARSLAGISLEGQIMPGMFKTNLHVLKFYEEINKENAGQSSKKPTNSRDGKEKRKGIKINTVIAGGAKRRRRV